MKKSRSPHARDSGRYRFRERVLAILLDPIALIVLLVLVLYSAPGDAMGAVLLSVLILCGVEGLLVDLLGVLGQVVLDAVGQLRNLLVGHLDPFRRLPEDTYPLRASEQSERD